MREPLKVPGSFEQWNTGMGLAERLTACVRVCGLCHQHGFLYEVDDLLFLDALELISTIVHSRVKGFAEKHSSVTPVSFVILICKNTWYATLTNLSHLCE